MLGGSNLIKTEGFHARFNCAQPRYMYILNDLYSEVVSISYNNAN